MVEVVEGDGCLPFALQCRLAATGRDKKASRAETLGTVTGTFSTVGHLGGEELGKVLPSPSGLRSLTTGETNRGVADVTGAARTLFRDEASSNLGDRLPADGPDRRSVRGDGSATR